MWSKLSIMLVVLAAIGATGCAVAPAAPEDGVSPRPDVRTGLHPTNSPEVATRNTANSVGDILYQDNPPPDPAYPTAASSPAKLQYPYNNCLALAYQCNPGNGSNDCCWAGLLLTAGSISQDDFNMSSGVACDLAVDGSYRCNLY
jgi:hypothetical protein